MSEPFIKFNMWMAKTGLNPSELIIFAVIHSFTESGGSYFGGISTLKEWTGCGERTVQNALKHLVSEGWVIDKAEAVFKRELVKLENSPIDPKYIKAEPFDFMNAKINIPRGGPLSGEY